MGSLAGSPVRQWRQERFRGEPSDVRVSGQFEDDDEDARSVRSNGSNGPYE
jgi:hypothetical protein